MTGYLVPCPPTVSPKATVVAKDADATLTVADFGTTITNTGAGGAVVLTLPAASTAAGCALRVQLTVAQIVKLTPATGEKIYLGGSGVASKYAQIAAAISNYVCVFCDGVDYLITDYSGVVTKEA